MADKKPLIAIVNSSSFGISYPEHLRKLEEFADLIRVDIPNNAPASVFHEKLREADGIIASVTPVYTREVLLGLPKLQLLARHGVGCDNVDLAACVELGIAVSKVGPEIERESVAQMAVGLMNASARRICEGADVVKAGQWAKRAKLALGVDFKGATIGLIGIGAIGKTVARILTLGFQAKVIAYDPYVSAEEVAARVLKATEDSGRTLCLDFIDQTLVAMHPPRGGRVISPEVFDLEKDEPLRLELSHFADCVAGIGGFKGGDLFKRPPAFGRKIMAVDHQYGRLPCNQHRPAVFPAADEVGNAFT